MSLASSLRRLAHPALSCAGHTRHAMTPIAITLARPVETRIQWRWLATSAEPSRSISLTDKAAKQLQFINQRDNNPRQMLRVLVDSGGCHGYQNKMELTETVEEDDVIFEKNGAKVVVDSVSLQYLNGSQVDFVEELIGSTFQVVNNPNAKHTCGCNISYDIDLDKVV